MKIRHFLRFWSPAMLLAIQSGIWALVWIKFYSNEIPTLIYWKGHLLVASIYFVMLFLVSSFYGGLQVGYHHAADVALSGIIALIIANFITWVQVCLIGTDIMTPLPIIVMIVAQSTVDGLWAVITEKLYIRTIAPHRMLMLYGGSPHHAQRLTDKLTTRSERYHIQETLDVRDWDIGTLCACILKHSAVVICDVPPAIHSELQRFCYSNSIQVYAIPGVNDVLTRGALEMNLFDTPLLLNRNQGINEEQNVAKRFADILIAVLGFVILSPLMLLTALAVKLNDGGPAIYAQERLTIGGKRFMLYKFRSMKVLAEENCARLSTQNDDRITPVGRVIRRLRIDETPQLVNIIKGEMSIVGPRPERPGIAEEYCKTMPEFAYRLKVKAGLTGYAQILGNYNTDPWDKLLMDLIYISSYTPVLDFKIMLMTLKTLFQKERTEGITVGNTTALDKKDKAP